MILIFKLLILISYCYGQDLVVVNTGTIDDAEAVVTNSDNIEVSNDEVFIATDEWQEVRPGQVVPSGLHVRYTTGCPID